MMDKSAHISRLLFYILKDKNNRLKEKKGV